MPGVQQCAPSCCTTLQTVNVPGNPGNNGTNGVSAFTVTTSDVVVPAIGASVNIPVGNSSWMVIGMIVIVGEGPSTIAAPGPATFEVTAIPSNASFTGKFLSYPGDVVTGSVIGTNVNTGGANVSPGSQGFQSPVTIANGGTGQTTVDAAANALDCRRRILRFENLDFNSTADQALAGFPARYIIRQITAHDASVNMTTAAGGIYPAPAKGGTKIVAAAQVYTALTTANKFVNLTLDATAGGPTTDVQTASTLYLSLTTAQGAPATADLCITFEDVM